MTAGRGASFNVIAGAVVTGAGLLVNVLVGRWLGPEVYAAYGVVVVLMTLAYTFLSTGVKETVAREVAASPETARPMIAGARRVQVALALAFTAAFLALGWPAARLFHDASLQSAVWMAATPLVPVALLAIDQGVLAGQQRFGAQSSQIVVYGLVRLGATVAAVWLGFGLLGVLGGFLVAAVVAVAFGRALAREPRGESGRRAVGILHASRAMLSLAALSAALQYADFLVVRALVADSTVVGQYNAAGMIARALMWVVGNAFAVAVLPVVARVRSESGPRAAAASLSASLRWQLIPLGLGVAVFSAWPEQALRFLFGPEFAGGAPLVLPLSLGMAGYCTLWVAANGAVGVGLARPAVVVLAAAVGAGPLLEAPLLLRFGPAGAAWGAALVLWAGAGTLAALLGHALRNSSAPPR